MAHISQNSSFKKKILCASCQDAATSVHVLILLKCGKSFAIFTCYDINPPKTQYNSNAMDNWLLHEHRTEKPSLAFLSFGIGWDVVE